MERWHIFWRILTLAPFILLVTGGLLQASRTRLDFSETVPLGSEVPLWVISVDGLLLSLPFALVGVWGAWIAWPRTRGRFRLDFFHAGIGLAGVMPTAFILFLFRQDQESSFSYRMVVGDDVTARGSLAITLVAAAVWCGLVWAFQIVYAHGLVPEGSGKYDKRAGEFDAMGTLITEMKRR